MLALLDLIQQDVSLHRVSTRDGGEFAGPCPLCGGTDRFHVWPYSQRNVKFWCRSSGNGCGLSGDEITYLRQVRGLSFRDAAALVGKEVSETDTARQARERAVKARLLQDYWRWFHRTYAAACAAFRALSAEIAEAAIGYRATVRRPDLYSEEECAYWEQRLGHLYDLLASVEHACDVFTYNQHLPERLAWWESEGADANGKRADSGRGAARDPRLSGGRR